MKRLSAATLAEVRGAELPTYDRCRPATIAHLGVGAFARAHVATYADDLLRGGVPAMIRGVSMRSRRVEEALAPQDGLYSVTTREPATPPSARVIGALGSVATGIGAATEAIADPRIELVTITVTEKGYELDGPGSLPAVLAAALGDRRRRTDAPVVLASLDNLLDNGTVLRRQVLRAATAATAAGDDLAAWIADRVAFPCSVVDRMVPASTDADRAEVAHRLGVLDEAAVVGETHRSWVISAAGGLPPLDRAGVEVVDDIEPYQRRKLWLLNGPHSAVAYAGLLAGDPTIAEAIGDPVITRFVRGLVDDVLAVAGLADVDPAAYAEASLRRFANPALGHRCAQVAADGSRKLPQRVLPVMAQRAGARLGNARLATVVAIWLAAVAGVSVRGAELPAVDDPAAEDLRAALAAGGVAAALDSLGAGFVAHADAVHQAYRRVVREGVGALEVGP